MKVVTVNVFMVFLLNMLYAPHGEAQIMEEGRRNGRMEIKRPAGSGLDHVGQHDERRSPDR